MKRTVIYIILTLAIPALCHGSIGPAPRLEFPVFETAEWNAYHLEVERELQTSTVRIGSLDLAPVVGEKYMAGHSLDEIHGGIPYSARPAPKDMVSMMSFVWAEMFGGVDIVAEVKDFARQIRRKGRHVKTNHRKGPPAKAIRQKVRDSRNRWRFIVAYRIDEQTEVAALFKNRGWFFGEGSMALKINALDPISEEIGLTMTYSDGDLDFRADRMTLTETAAAKLEFKF